MCKDCCVEVESLFGGWCFSVSWLKDFGIFEFGNGYLDCFWIEGVL